MGEIELKLDRSQYEVLLKLVYLGNWVANGIYPSAEQDGEFNEIEQLVMSKAAEAGLDDLIERDEKTGAFYANSLFENLPDIGELINDYDDETFWDELVWRLTERELNKKYGQSKVAEMSPADRVRAKILLLEHYEKEVQKYGLERMVEKP
jgi:hypothetical protein